MHFHIERAHQVLSTIDENKLIPWYSTVKVQNTGDKKEKLQKVLHTKHQEY